MKFLIIINGAAYGQDATYNALRLAKTLAQHDNASLRIFLMGDGVTAAMAGQKTPDGCYKLERMLNDTARHGAQIGCCGTCMDARGITDELLLPAARRSTMNELADWTIGADKVLVF